MRTRKVVRMFGGSGVSQAMKEQVQSAFRSTIEFLPSEFEVMPLSRWTESVLRYYFCRFLAAAHPEVEQFVECDKIDLVLRKSPLRAFLEFKLYRHALRFDAYNGELRGFKGGPGRKNLREFQTCIDQLHERPSAPDLSKYVVLVYADPMGASRPSLRFARDYDQYKHPCDKVALRVVESSELIETKHERVRAQLYEVGFEAGARPSQTLHVTESA